ncbi:MAG: hypothetical protein JWO30_4941 [Fibrobacteres bacterium]|nr:hypothetical protein [Fibrobacterota bacterium]
MKFVRWAFLIAGLAGGARCQTEIFTPSSGKAAWSADTLYVSPDFRYFDGGPITVTLKSAETSQDGVLYAINPASGETLRLFSNRDAPGSEIDVMKSMSLPAGGTLVFMYDPENNGPIFTGPNLPGDKYFTEDSNDRYGHRWSVAGKVDKSTIEFGFEDFHPLFNSKKSDFDFDDIIFQVKGLSLVVMKTSARKRSYIW